MSQRIYGRHVGILTKTPTKLALHPSPTTDNIGYCLQKFRDNTRIPYRIFPPLQSYPPVTAFSSDTHFHQLPMMPISREDIAKAVFSVSPLKGVGPDSIPAMIWQKLWPIIQDEVVSLFTASVKLGVIPEQWKTARIIPLRKPQKLNTP